MYRCCPVGDPTPPILELGSGPGLRLKGDVLCVRGECKVVRAEVVAPGLVAVEVVMVRGFDGEDTPCEVDVLCVCEEEEGDEDAFPCCRAECARKAARKLERKGRFVGILLFYLEYISTSWSRRAECV